MILVKRNFTMFPAWKDDWMRRHVNPRLDKEQAHRIRCMNLFPSMPWGECVEREYWDNGILWRETHWKNGKRHGMARMWRVDGVLWHEKPWVRGACVRLDNITSVKFGG